MIKELTDEEFDEYFDNGGDISEYIDVDSIRHINAPDTPRKINISMPEWMLDVLDRQAKHFAISRQALINLWIAERMQDEGLI